jgi:predicted transcriptional regulator
MGSISDNIRRCRGNIGVTQTELANRIDKACSVVSHYESGRTRLRIGTVGALTTTLGV